ncbi:MAG: hypothetical protein WC009_12670 [Methylotenera sp.]
MKNTRKLSLKKRETKLRIERKKFTSTIARKYKYYSETKELTSDNSNIEGNLQRNKEGYLLLELPEKIDLNSNYSEMTAVLKSIRKLVLSEKKPICLTFNNVKFIKPSALLILAAEIHRCRRIHGIKKITGHYPKDKKIEGILEDFGFFKLLGVASRNNSKNKKYPMEYIDFVTHIHEVKGTVRAFRESLLGKSIEMSGPAKGRLYRAITEAMLNVRHHAYPLSAMKTNPERGRWWLSGHVNKKNGDLVIMFC